MESVIAVYAEPVGWQSEGLLVVLEQDVATAPVSSYTAEVPFVYHLLPLLSMAMYALTAEALGGKPAGMSSAFPAVAL